jgi:hypothetical protein
MKASADCMQRIGREILLESKAYLIASGEKHDSGARDLLSLLLKLNMNTDLPLSQRMSDPDVIARKHITVCVFVAEAFTHK